MEKEKNARHCYSCRHFCRYFTMGAKKFTPAKVGWCSCIGDVINSCGSCNKFSQKMYKKKDIKLTKYFLNEIFCEISQIRDILSEHEKDK